MLVKNSFVISLPVNLKFSLNNVTQLFRFKLESFLILSQDLKEPYFFCSSNIYKFEIIKKLEINSIEQNIIKLRKKFLKSIFEIYPSEEAIFL